MKKHTNTGVPSRGACFHGRAYRIFTALLLTLLTVGMPWQNVPDKTSAQARPAAVTLKRDGVRMGDSVTIAAYPVSPDAAQRLLPKLKKRNVHIVFMLSREQAENNGILIIRMRGEGHRVVVRGEGGEPVIHLRAGDIAKDRILYELSDGCVLLCPASSEETCGRLLQIADTLRTQGVRMPVSQSDDM